MIGDTVLGTSMLTASALLGLMRLASPALPVGGFSYSEGLEAAVDSGRVTDEATTAAWLTDQLDLGLARSDLGIVGEAIEAWRRHDRAAIGRLNDWVSSTRETAELRRQSEQMGRSMLEWLKHHDATEARATARGAQLATLQALTPAPTWPIAFALAAADSGAPRREAMLAFAFGWAEAMVQAALKAVPLGQNAGQRVLGALMDAIPATVDAAAALAPDDRQAFTPMLAILSSRHESQYSRLFRS